MNRFTVILKMCGWFFGDAEDSSKLFHIDAHGVEEAIAAAQKELAEENECEEGCFPVGGMNEVMPAIYVFEGHLNDILPVPVVMVDGFR